MKSWEEDIQKVSLSKLQAELLKMSLKKSKSNVDLLLEGKEVILEIDNEILAREYLKRAKELGVNCSIECN